MNNILVPGPVGRLLSLLPSFPGSMLFASTANMVLKERLPEDVQQAIAGKLLRLSVTDARIDFDFAWTKSGFVPAWGGGEPDLTIAASAHDFILLAQRREDPDTLFFSRRLVMEGDTELGLLLKNTLDAMELNVAEQALAMPRGLLAGVLSKLKPPF